MTTDDAISILKVAKPEAAIFTHFGMQMIFREPQKEAARATRESQVPVTAAIEGMRVVISDEIQIVKPADERSTKPNSFLNR